MKNPYQFVSSLGELALWNARTQLHDFFPRRLSLLLDDPDPFDALSSEVAKVACCNPIEDDVASTSDVVVLSSRVVAVRVRALSGHLGVDSTANLGHTFHYYGVSHGPNHSR